MYFKKLLLLFLTGILTYILLNSFLHVNAQNLVTIAISKQPMGVSTRYIGAVEGNVNFDIKDLQDLGINTYRIYGGMSRWEAEDDDGIYGQPTISEIKANPNIINWDWWDKIMTEPPNNSDYWWSGNDTWQGNARTIFSQLKQANIRPVVTLRNTDDAWNPSWALQLNPPRNEADWNEWWEHIFATVYWLNVRNDYQVDEFEIHNEPDNRPQGWGGNQADYFELVKVAKDALDFVYKNYLPNRKYHIHAPVTIENSTWVLDALQQIPTYFDSINIHDYQADISVYTQQVHTWMNSTIHANSPIWLGEWGTYQTDYENLDFALNLIKNLLRGSLPGDNYIYGSHVFSLYDWGQSGIYRGLISAEGKRSLGYYALRMGIRGLQGGKKTWVTSTSNSDLIAIATQDNNSDIYLLVINSSQESYPINADFSDFFTEGIGTIWEFSQQHRDEIVNSTNITQGQVNLTVPSQAAILVKIGAN
ncbi:MAG: hypothetical protein F6K45_01535 [Kamptonema sp. SIO1D9]|nr:hypothetical protein [Kamptonema sp. SIO1D9]